MDLLVSDFVDVEDLDVFEVGEGFLVDGNLGNTPVFSRIVNCSCNVLNALSASAVSVSAFF